MTIEHSWHDTNNGKPKHSEKICSSTTLPSQIPQRLARDRTQNALVTCWQLTTWAMAGPTKDQREKTEIFYLFSTFSEYQRECLNQRGCTELAAGGSWLIRSFIICTLQQTSHQWLNHGWWDRWGMQYSGRDEKCMQVLCGETWQKDTTWKS